MNRPGEIFRHEGAAPARFTAAEFLRMADLGAFDDMKVELDHGELVRMNPPFAPHGSMQAKVIGALTLATDLGLDIYGETGILLAPDTVRACDAALAGGIEPGRTLLDARQVRLVVEISDATLETDLGDKLRDYAAAGIPLYWVVDPNARVVHVMEMPEGEAYGKRAVVRFGEPLALPGGGTIVLG